MNISNPIRTFQDFSKLNWGDVPHVEWEKWCEEVVALTPYGTKIGKGKLNFAQEGEKLYWGNKNKTCVYQFDIDTTEQEKLDFINYQLQKRAEKALEKFLAEGKVALVYEYSSGTYGNQTGSSDDSLSIVDYNNECAEISSSYCYSKPDIGRGYYGNTTQSKPTKSEEDEYYSILQKVEDLRQEGSIAFLRYEHSYHLRNTFNGGRGNYTNYRFEVPIKTKKGTKIWCLDIEEGKFPFLPIEGSWGSFEVEKPADFDDKLNQFWESGNKEIALNLYCGQKGINPLFAILAVKLENASK